MRTRWLSSLPLREGCCDLREDTENCENEEIVNSPVADKGAVGTSAPGGFGPIGNTEVVDLTLPASSDEGMEVDRAGSRSVSLGSTLVEDYGELSSSFEQVPYKGKKGRHKPKGSNALGSRAMAKISSRRLELGGRRVRQGGLFQDLEKGGTRSEEEKRLGRVQPRR